MAQCTGKKVGNMYWNIGNAHIYDRHLEDLEQQVNRKYKSQSNPKLILPDGKDFFECKLSDVKIEGYHPLDGVKYEVAI